jgi:hypothetical protein
MRRASVLVVAAVAALSPVPAASAHDEATDASPCPDPQVQVWDYTSESFTAGATLLASGCPAREGRQFPLWLSVTRYEETSVHGHTTATLCGPFQPASESGDHRYACEVDVTIDHPPTEQATYTVEATYPGADGEETMAFDVVCVSEEDSYGCELADDPAPDARP